LGLSTGDVVALLTDNAPEAFEVYWAPFEYHNDPEKTTAARHPDHENWSTVGDIGYLDADGYLYRTDRKSFMIISGGVNTYPRKSRMCWRCIPAWWMSR
jgi:hypothetical protein